MPPNSRKGTLKIIPMVSGGAKDIGFKRSIAQLVLQPSWTKKMWKVLRELLFILKIIKIKTGNSLMFFNENPEIKNGNKTPLLTRPKLFTCSHLPAIKSAMTLVFNLNSRDVHIFPKCQFYTPCLPITFFNWTENDLQEAYGKVFEVKIQKSNLKNSLSRYFVVFFCFTKKLSGI